MHLRHLIGSTSFLVVTTLSIHGIATTPAPSHVVPTDRVSDNRASLLVLTSGDSQTPGFDPRRGFPPLYVPRAYDPINRREYQHVIVGPTVRTDHWHRPGTWFDGYDHARYVTVYNAVRQRDQRLASWPILRQECHDAAEEWGGWEQEVSFSVSLEAGVEFEMLGLDWSLKAAIENGVTNHVNRQLETTRGIQADYVPHASFEYWEGVTFVETYRTRDGHITHLPARFYQWTGLYPMRFSLTNQNMLISVRRENVRECTDDPPARRR